MPQKYIILPESPTLLSRGPRTSGARAPSAPPWPPAAGQAPEVAAAAAAAEHRAAGRPGPCGTHHWEHRPRAEPPVDGLPCFRVHAARRAGPAENGLQSRRAGGDPPAAGPASAPV